MINTPGQIKRVASDKPTEEKFSRFESILDKVRIGTTKIEVGANPTRASRLEHVQILTSAQHSFHGYRKADDKTEPPNDFEVKDIHNSQNGSIAYISHSDGEIIVEKHVTPELYTAVEQILLTREAMQNGYRLMIGNVNAFGRQLAVLDQS